MNLDDVRCGRVSVRQAAALAAQLPLGSRVLARIDKRMVYTESDWLLLGIYNMLRETPYNPFEEKKTQVLAMDIDEMREYLARPREDVTNV